MGRDKAELVLDNVRLVDRAKSLLERTGCTLILISSPDDLPDRHPGGGPLSGIDAAAASLRDGDVLLVMPVDMPNLSANLLAELLEELGARAGVYFEGQPLPLCLRVSVNLRRYLQDVLQANDADRSLFSLFKTLGFDGICPPQDSENEFANCNTPQQFEAMGGSL